MSPTGNFKTPERPFTHADVVHLARNAIKRFRGNAAKAHGDAMDMADRWESYKWEQVMDYLRNGGR
jgi:hypothetical protein